MRDKRQVKPAGKALRFIDNSERKIIYYKEQFYKARVCFRKKMLRALSQVAICYIVL